MPEQRATPPELHEALVRVGGDVHLLGELELVEIGVGFEHAASHARFLAALTAGAVDPLGTSGDALCSYDYWLREYDERHTRGDESYD
jgi:hypothetical protein